MMVTPLHGVRTTDPPHVNTQDRQTNKAMKKNNTSHIAAMTAAALAVLSLLAGCHGSSRYELILEDGAYVSNPFLEVYRTPKGLCRIEDSKTGKTVLKGVVLDPCKFSYGEALGVFYSGSLGGYYDGWTGKIVIPARYGRLWRFSEGVAAVLDGEGRLGFIDREGREVFRFPYPYRGASSLQVEFKDGVCVAPGPDGKLGVIGRDGTWVIPAAYDEVSTGRDHAVVTECGVRRQVAYDGTAPSSFLIDHIASLVISPAGECMEPGECERDSGMFAYMVDDRWGLVDSLGNRLTPPLYEYIEALSGHLFKARLDDGSGLCILLDDKGQTIK